MKEIISVDTFNIVVNVVAVVAPVLGITVGFIVARAKGKGSEPIIKGALLGELGILNWALWRIYRATTQQYGLSSTRSLLTVLTVFVVIGIAIGAAYAAAAAKSKQTD